jgi:hypothetical protein
MVVAARFTMRLIASSLGDFGGGSVFRREGYLRAGIASAGD